MATGSVWKSIFGWEALFRWDVLAAVVPGIFIAVGLAMLSIDWFPRHLLIAQVCLAIAGVLCVTKILGYAIESTDSIRSRCIFGITLCSIVLGGTVWIIRSIETHKRLEELKVDSGPLPKPPDSVSAPQKPHRESPPSPPLLTVLGGAPTMPRSVGDKAKLELFIKLNRNTPLTVGEGTGTMVAPFIADVAAREAFEEGLWNKLLTVGKAAGNGRPLQIPSAVSSVSLPMESAPADASDLEQFKSGDTVWYFIIRIVSKETGKQILGYCGFLRNDGRLILCRHHNEP